LGGMAAGLLFAANRMNQQSAAEDDKAAPPPESIYLNLDNNGLELEFSPQGSRVLATDQAGEITIVNSSQPAEVHFDTLRCEGPELHGGLVANYGKPNTSALVLEMKLPQNSLSQYCERGEQLPIVNAGRLSIVGHNYQYTLKQNYDDVPAGNWPLPTRG
jgi:hypothetical protein